MDIENQNNASNSKSPIIDLLIPIRTVSEMNTNEHWSKRHKRFKSQKVAIFNCWLAKYHMQQVPLPCIVILTRIAPRSIDSDNLQGALKTVRDMIAGIIIPFKRPGMADSSPFIEWQYKQEKGGVKQYGVKIQIFSSDPLINNAF